MAWFPISLLIIRRRPSTCATKMRVRFVYVRRRYIAMADMRHGFAPCNTHDFLVYGQKQIVGTRFLSENKRNTLKPNLSKLDEIF